MERTTLLSGSQKEQQPLLEEFGIIFMPEEIDYDAYKEMIWALTLGKIIHSDHPLRLYCIGFGGPFSYGIAIANLVQASGNIIGIASGETVSMHSVIWAACQKRLIYQDAIIGLHQIGATFDNGSSTGFAREDAPYHKLKLEGIINDNNAIANIYAKASNKDTEWWLAKLSQSNMAYVEIPAKEIVEDLEMAEFI